MFGKHAAYIIPSYIATAVVIVLLVGWIIVTYRRRQNEIAELEAKGITRTSAKKNQTGGEKE
ncbi:MAG: heme exporter protein CcmD [Salaquimonas sp.]